MNDAWKRAARTFFQGFVGVLAILAIPALNTIITSVGSGGTVTLDPTAFRSIGMAAVAGGFIALVSWVQNALEQKTGVAPLKENIETVKQDAYKAGLDDAQGAP